MGELTFQNKLINALCEINLEWFAEGDPWEYAWLRNTLAGARLVRCLGLGGGCRGCRICLLFIVSALVATQGQNDSFFSQLSYRCYLFEVASVGD